MALRKASSYSRRIARPYTRKSSVKSKSYIKTIPQSKIVKYQMGDAKLFEAGKFSIIIRLVCLENVQMRDTAIEASRQAVHKFLDTLLAGQYYFAVKPHPHHILRENKMLTGAGSDRMQTGMQLSFGKTVGRAALVLAGKDIFVIAVADEKAYRLVRKVLSTIKAKLPCKTRIVTERK